MHLVHSSAYSPKAIVVDLEGFALFTPEAEQLFKEDLPVREGALQSSPIIAAVRIGGWMPGRIPRCMIGRICKHFDALTAARIYLSASSYDHDYTYKRQVMLSCGGPLAGSIWTSIPPQWEYLTPSHFVKASQKRLATISVQDGYSCQLTEAVHSANPRKCGEVLDRRLIHPCAACNKGTREEQAA